MGNFIMISQFLLVITLIIGLHEFGHFAGAKLTGMRVEKFYIGFPPKIFSFRKGDTEYGLGAFMLGGFVKISGIIDESFDTEKLKEEPKEYEYRAKGPWSKLLFTAGGIIMNVLTAFVIFSMMLYAGGINYIPKAEADKYGINVSEVGEKVGFKTGDIILNVNGESYERFSELTSTEVILGEDVYFTVNRGGEKVRVEIPNNFLDLIEDDAKEKRMFVVRFPFEVAKVTKGLPAEQAGIEKGDRIVKIKDQEILYFDQLQKMVSNNPNKELSFTIKKENGEEIVKTIKVTEDGVIGLNPHSLIDYGVEEVGFFESIPMGVSKSFRIIADQIKGFKKIFKGDIAVSKSLAGPVKMATMFPKFWSWSFVWTMTGFLSMAIAFMNLLPIPALDGGHMVFIVYEILSGRAPSDKVLENAQKVGVAILLVLMVFVFGNDIWSLIKGFFGY